MRLVQRGESEKIFALFDARMAAAVSLDQVSHVVGSLGQVGKCLGEIIRVGVGECGYYADYECNGRILAVSIEFDRDGKISGLLLKLGQMLPDDPEAGYQAKGIYLLPFDGIWWVLWGGNTVKQNYHVVAADQRHAYDILIRKQGSTHLGDGRHLTDYYAFGQPLYSPTSATVVEAVDGVEDNVPGEMNAAQPCGNHVVLNCGNGEYLVMAHFKNHSLRVHTGDHVSTGQRVGECGDSGNSSEPHLHIHLQNGPILFRAAGLPLAFSSLIVDGKAVDRTELVRGEEVQTGL